MNLEKEQIRIISEYLSDKPVLKAWLFGSRVRGESNASSDIDILLELDYSKHIGLEFIKMKLDLEAKLKRKVDMVSKKALSKHILPFVNKDKQLIYERKTW
ncbi:MAG: nucleotidyltransferase domain-containing protein [Chitinophagales bacterium]